MEITRRISEYVVATDLEDFPPTAVQAARSAIIDCLACMLSGSKKPIADGGSVYRICRLLMLPSGRAFIECRILKLLERGRNILGAL